MLSLDQTPQLQTTNDAWDIPLLKNYISDFDLALMKSVPLVPWPSLKASFYKKAIFLEQVRALLQHTSLALSPQPHSGLLQTAALPSFLCKCSAHLPTEITGSHLSQCSGPMMQVCLSDTIPKGYKKCHCLHILVISMEVNCGQRHLVNDMLSLVL